MGIFDFLKGKSKEQSNAQVSESISTNATGAPQPDVVPVEKRTAAMNPLQCGLYPHQVLILDYAPKYRVAGDDYPGFWWYKYGVKNVDKELRNLAALGFLQDGGIASAVQAAKASEIKDFLKGQGLKVTGKKDELVARALGEADPEALKAAFPNSTYSLTEQGEEVLASNPAIPYVHNHDIDQLDIWNISEVSNRSASPFFRDAIWGHFNELSLGYAANGDFGLARNVYLQMAYFLAEENRYEEALSRLFEVVLWDLSGIGNNASPEMFIKVTANYLFPYEESLATVPPGITKLLEKYQEKLGMDEQAFESRAAEYYNKHVERLPIAVFTPEEYVEIIMLERYGDKSALNEVYAKAKSRFEKKYRVKLEQ